MEVNLKIRRYVDAYAFSNGKYFKQIITNQDKIKFHSPNSVYAILKLCDALPLLEFVKVMNNLDFSRSGKCF